MAKAATRAGFKAVVPQPFYIGKFEVTQEQYQKVMGTNPSYSHSEQGGQTSDKYPVDSVTWEDAQAFIRKLNAMGKTKAYRLPTEVEWEYAARAGTQDETQGAKRQEVAWFMTNAGYVTHPVGQKAPNAWGLYDMLGNVWEWVEDWYDEQVQPSGPKGPFRQTARSPGRGLQRPREECARLRSCGRTGQCDLHGPAHCQGREVARISSTCPSASSRSRSFS